MAQTLLKYIRNLLFFKTVPRIRSSDYLSLSGKHRSSVKPLNVQSISKKSTSMVGFEITEKLDVIEVEDFEELAKKLENVSPFEIMDQAHEKSGNDIVIAFR